MARNDAGDTTGLPPIFDKIMARIITYINRRIDEKTSRVLTDDGKLRLGKRNTTGYLPPERGGFHDHAHSGAGGDGQQLTEANTHEDLDTAPSTRKHWTREDIQDMIAGGFLVAGDNITLAYDDTSGTLTIASTGGGSEIPPPPDTYVYLTDDDGSYLTDDDGAYLWEAA